MTSTSSLDQTELEIPSSSATDIPNIVYPGCFEAENVTTQGIKALLWHATTDSSSQAGLSCRYRHCGMRAGLLVSVFPVIVFPLLSFGPSLCFWAFFFHIVGILEKDTRKQNHVMRGFCRRRRADVSQHTTWLCSAAGHCVTELHGGNSGAAEGKDDWTGFC